MIDSPSLFYTTNGATMRTSGGEVLHRVVAAHDLNTGLGVVPAGEVGGWVSDSVSMSPTVAEGDTFHPWVAEEAQVTGTSTLTGSAYAAGNARIHNTRLQHGARVNGDATLISPDDQTSTVGEGARIGGDVNIVDRCISVHGQATLFSNDDVLAVTVRGPVVSIHLTGYALCTDDGDTVIRFEVMMSPVHPDAATVFPFGEGVQGDLAQVEEFFSGSHRFTEGVVGDQALRALQSARAFHRNMSIFCDIN